MVEGFSNDFFSNFQIIKTEKISLVDFCYDFYKDIKFIATQHELKRKSNNTRNRQVLNKPARRSSWKKLNLDPCFYRIIVCRCSIDQLDSWWKYKKWK